MPADSWLVTAVFETHAQAEHAAKLLRSLNPRETEHIAFLRGKEVWASRSLDYGAEADDVRL